MVININLLPAKYKKKTYIFKICDYLPYLVLVSLALIVFNILFAGILSFENISFSRLKKVWDRKSPDYRAVVALNRELSLLREKKKSLESLILPKVCFSQFMYELYKSLPLNVWFDELSYDSKKVKIAGRAVDFNTGAVSALKEFVKNIKSSRYFNNVNIDSMKKERIKNTDILYFRITLENG